MSATEGAADAELRTLLVEQFTAFNDGLQRIGAHLSSIDGHLRQAGPSPHREVAAAAVAPAMPVGLEEVDAQEVLAPQPVQPCSRTRRHRSARHRSGRTLPPAPPRSTWPNTAALTAPEVVRVGCA